LFLFSKQTKPVKQEVNGTVILPPFSIPWSISKENLSNGSSATCTFCRAIKSNAAVGLLGYDIGATTLNSMTLGKTTHGLMQAKLQD
jgi:hypothetical protein